MYNQAFIIIVWKLCLNEAFKKKKVLIELHVPACSNLWATALASLLQHGKVLSSPESGLGNKEFKL